MAINNFTDLTGGLPGLIGTSFSPMPGTPIGAAARRQATSPALSLEPVTRATIPTFRPTTQAVLPTQLLRTPETIGQQAFRPVQEEITFPQLLSMEEIEERMNLFGITPPIREQPIPTPRPSGRIMGQIVPAPMVGLPPITDTTPTTIIEPIESILHAPPPPLFRIESVDEPQLAYGTPPPQPSGTGKPTTDSYTRTPTHPFGAHGSFGASRLVRL